MYMLILKELLIAIQLMTIFMEKSNEQGLVRNHTFLIEQLKCETRVGVSQAELDDRSHGTR